MAIPEGWLQTSPDCGKAIKHIIPCKVPLKKEFGQAFTPAALVELQRQSGNTIGMVVDLTFTKRYYNGKEEFEDQGIEYVKIMVPGQEIPPEPLIQEFIAKVQDYKARHPAKYIIVHCTHGINRTGFFIVSYLVQRHRFSVVKALDDFGVARGQHLFDRMFIDFLRKQYGAPPALSYPAPPEWDTQRQIRREEEARKKSMMMQGSCHTEVNPLVHYCYSQLMANEGHGKHAYTEMSFPPSMHAYGGPPSMHSYGGPSSMHPYGGPPSMHPYGGPPSMHSYGGPARRGEYGNGYSASRAPPPSWQSSHTSSNQGWGAATPRDAYEHGMSGRSTWTDRTADSWVREGDAEHTQQQAQHQQHTQHRQRAGHVAARWEQDAYTVAVRESFRYQDVSQGAATHAWSRDMQGYDNQRYADVKPDYREYANSERRGYMDATQDHMHAAHARDLGRGGTTCDAWNTHDRAQEGKYGVSNARAPQGRDTLQYATQGSYKDGGPYRGGVAHTHSLNGPGMPHSGRMDPSLTSSRRFEPNGPHGGGHSRSDDVDSRYNGGGWGHPERIGAKRNSASMEAGRGYATERSINVDGGKRLRAYGT